MYVLGGKMTGASMSFPEGKKKNEKKHGDFLIIPTFG